MRFIRGNPDDLKGRVLVYSQLVGDLKGFPEEAREMIRERPYISFYGSADPTEPVEKIFQSMQSMGLPIRFEFDADSKNQVMEHLKKMNDSGQHVFFCAPIAPMSEEDISAIGRNYPLEDIIDAGRFKSTKVCFSCMQSAMSWYVPAYFDKKIPEFCKGKREEVHVDEVKYSALDKRKLSGYLTSTFVTRMMDARRNGDSDTLQTLGGRMFDFAKGSPIQHDVLELYEVLESGSGRVCDVPLVELYVQKMHAVANEDWENAAIFRDKIRAAKGKST